jgi:glycosyltransferase involved in cell wall biosynthesis
VPFEIIPNFVTRPPLPTEPATRDLITIGTIEPRKNQGYIVDVVAEAHARGRDLTATIVGEGPDRSQVEARAVARGVAHLINFPGFVPDAARLIPQHRVYTHSSTYESFCIAAAEGLSYGRPVVAAPVGGLPEVFDDGVEGRYWPLDSAQRGAEILLEVLDHPEVYGRMAKAARLRFETRLDSDVVVPRLYDFLQRVGAGSAA